MKRLLSPFILFVFCTHSFAQVEELENFREKLSLFVDYDKGLVDSIPRSDANTTRLKNAARESFRLFVLHKDSKNLDSLKALARNEGGSYNFDNYSYLFNELRRVPTIRSLDGTTDYGIVFYGLYDYGMPYFITVYIQPFTVAGEKYVIYYYSTNQKGTYCIKDVLKNKIVYTGAAVTHEAPVQKLYRIDSRHLLLVENMADKGQRALVLNAEKADWHQVEVFKGNSFPDNATDFSKKALKDKRAYLWVASNKMFATEYGTRYLTITFDETSKILSYTQFLAGNATKKIEAKWQNNQFIIDDYYLGEYLNDDPIPMPGPM